MKLHLFTYPLIFLIHSNLTIAEDDLLSQQRWQFKEAQHALATENFTLFNQRIEQLHDYPIVYYLRYFHLKDRLHIAPIAELFGFLNHYADSPITQRLQQQWLQQLATQQQWATFLSAYTPQTEITLQCNYLHALLATETPWQPADFTQAKTIWMVDHSQPQACDSAFDYLHQQTQLTPHDYWQRIRLAIQKGNFKLALHLGKQLPKTDVPLLNLWQNLHHSPENTLKNFKQTDTELTREMLVYGLKQLANTQPDKAKEYWQLYQKQYTFNRAQRKELQQLLASKETEKNPPVTTAWKITDPKFNEETGRAHLQKALLQQNWSEIAESTQNLPIAENNKLRWSYWRARALEQLGNITEAEQYYRTVAQQRDYYGFLSAERLGEPYQLQVRSLPRNLPLETQLSKRPGIIRARELYFVGLAEYAQLEWNTALDNTSPEELPAATWLAHQWGWHYQAIVTIAKIPFWDDLNIRFPLAFHDAISRHAETQQLPLAWVYAIVRQESALQVEAKSRAGALGLMQLLPGTAKEMARIQKVDLLNDNLLFTPDMNIQLGTTYLKTLLKQFSDNYLLATAAYNAGPGRAKRWQAQYSCLPADIWVELIPFSETHQYVKNVMSYTLVYEHQLGNKPPLGPMLLSEIKSTECAPK